MESHLHLLQPSSVIVFTCHFSLCTHDPPTVIGKQKDYSSHSYHTSSSIAKRIQKEELLFIPFDHYPNGNKKQIVKSFFCTTTRREREKESLLKMAWTLDKISEVHLIPTPAERLSSLFLILEKIKKAAHREHRHVLAFTCYFLDQVFVSHCPGMQESTVPYPPGIFCSCRKEISRDENCLGRFLPLTSYSPVTHIKIRKSSSSSASSFPLPANPVSLSPLTSPSTDIRQYKISALVEEFYQSSFIVHQLT